MTHWLLDLTWGGRVFRFASSDVEVLDADGVSLPYVGGLVPRYEIGAPIGEVQADIEVDLGDLVFPVDVALWHRQGRPLVGCAAELSTWTEGDTWEERRVRLSGRVTASEYGAEGEPVALVLRWDGGQDRGEIVTPAEVVDAVTWTGSDAASHGRPYPRVLGLPGLGLSTGTAANIVVSGGTELTIIGAGVLLLCGHPVEGATATVLRVQEDGTGTFEASQTITAALDGTLRIVSTITPTTMTVEYKSRYYVDWTSVSGSTRAIDGDGHVDSVAQWFEWLIDRSSSEWDARAWGSIELPGYRLAGYIDEAGASPLDFIRREVLPLLPVSAVPGPRGLQPVVWRIDARVTDARFALIEGENCERASPLALDVESVRNSWTVRYAPRADDGEPSRIVTVDETNHPACAASRTYLPTATETIETAYIYDEATARRVASWRAAAFALPIETVTYDILDDALDLAVGDVVALTDDGLHLSSRVAHVARVAYDGAGVSVDLVMFGLPGRDYLEE